MAIIGYNTIGGTSGTISSTNKAQGVLVNTYTAVTNDVVTNINWYGSSATSQTVDIAIYVFSGGNPTTRLATPVTLTINSSTPQWWTATVNWNLVAGTVYCIAQGNWTGTNQITQYNDTGSAGSLAISTQSALANPWTAFSNTGTNEYSLYATVTNVPPTNSFNNFMFVKVGDGMSTTEKIR